MIPLKLTIEGLYSYQEKQTIDFTKLTDAGFFGVFGSVGSGKSSILEAITFALYGETERMNKRDNRAYNMMNLKSSKSFIEFDFINFENRIFRIIRDFRRNSKKFDDVKTQTPTFYEKIDGNFIPLAHTDAARIINLSYTNFKRTIIIPQGQFKEFIELGATDRTKMMKEIYPELEKFDLYHKASKLNDENKSALDVLMGTLAGFEGISQENINLLEEDLGKEKDSLKTLRDVFTPISEHFNKLKTLKDDFNNLETKQNELDVKNEEKIAIDELAKETAEYEKIHQIFFQKFEDRKRTEKEYDGKNALLTSETENLGNLNKELEKITKKIDELKEDFENLPTKRKEEIDLQKIIEIKRLEKEESDLESDKKAKLENQPDLLKKKVDLEKNIENTESEINELNKNILDAELLLVINNWFSARNNFQDDLIKLKNDGKSRKDEILRLNRELEILEIDPKKVEINFDSEKDKLKERRETMNLRKSNFDLRTQLSKYAEHLHNGEACPLCGSDEHPKIIEIEDLTAEKASLKTDFENLENDETKLADLEKKVDKIFHDRRFYQEQFNIAKEKYGETEKELNKHKETFIWKQFDAENEDNFMAARDLSNNNQKEISTRQKAIKKNREDLKDTDIKLQEITDATKDIDIKIGRIQGQIAQNSSQIQLLKLQDFKEKTLVEVQDLFNQNLAKNNQLEKDLLELENSKKEILPKITASETRKNTLEDDVKRFDGEKTSVQDQILQLISDHQIESEEFISNTLSKTTDVSANNEKIKNFNIAYGILKSSIAELEKKLKDLSFSEEEFSASETKFNEASKNVDEANRVVIQKEAVLSRQKGELQKMKEHLDKKEALEKRALNLSKMINLFKGSGFVEYVSSIYLGNLCDNANERFHKMTRNQLSLRVNESNDFEIIDYLNDGKSRSVKTLSGGQSFQVSLSLALALAESVQSHAKADRNFFFIDEGFGTQDQESVNIVFETLMNLQKENRIVGIISHVEELKEKIPVSLSITKDAERGSLIEMV
ncbi:TPA: SbcC/MukB-like Walker B domain-containing protein [Elizabethkingia anophelis]|uniref:SbcC/MukB-like Walker B domain-containing protein n=1 Tax=Elizabethkingia anophelis TaxID=1117645 RepID=UPI003731EF06